MSLKVEVGNHSFDQKVSCSSSLFCNESDQQVTKERPQRAQRHLRGICHRSELARRRPIHTAGHRAKQVRSPSNPIPAIIAKLGPRTWEFCQYEINLVKEYGQSRVRDYVFNLSRRQCDVTTTATTTRQPNGVPGWCYSM